jgi:acyl carrier protein
MENYLRERVAGVVGCSVDDVDPRASLKEIDLDSMGALDLMFFAEVDLGIPMNVETFLDAPDLSSIARVLLTQLVTAGVPEPSFLTAAVDEASKDGEEWEEGLL